nr:hypothetical protein JVH1_3954 [Rhodococcus sp. JVH1]
MESLHDLGRNPTAGRHFATLSDRPLADLLGCPLRRTFGNPR